MRGAQLFPIGIPTILRKQVISKTNKVPSWS